jgi:hypothetical protein
MHFTPLSHTALQRLVEGAEILEADGWGPKVYRLADGSFLKIFRRKRLLTSALWAPYAKRFCDNAEALKALDIPTLTPLALYRIEGSALTAVHYMPLAGETLRQRSRANGFDWPSIMPSLVNLIRRLHDAGVYFRSLHLGNIVSTPDGELGLIDIADMRFIGHSLPKYLRKRNLSHLEHYLDKEKLTSFPIHELRSALLSRPN